MEKKIQIFGLAGLACLYMNGSAGVFYLIFFGNN